MGEGEWGGGRFNILPEYLQVLLLTISTAVPPFSPLQPDTGKTTLKKISEYFSITNILNQNKSPLKRGSHPQKIIIEKIEHYLSVWQNNGRFLK